MMSTIARSLSAAAAPASKPWTQRILLGIWGTSYLPLCARELPGYAVTNICFSTFYARQFLRHPYVSFNALAVAISLWPLGALFIRAAHARSRSVLAWTVNDERTMRWSIRSGVDGVITDDPRRFRAVSAEWRAGKTGGASLKRDQVFRAAWFNALGLVFAFVIWQWRLRERLGGTGGGRARYKQLSGPGSMQNGRMT
jgi:tubulin gamma